ncbi:MAG: hypothetical protein ACKVIF_08905 [Rhodospirillales bacterium]|jgi:uncharacterized membrane protein
MSLMVTLIALLGAVAVFAFSLWMDKREYEPGALRYPAKVFLFVSLLVAIALLAHVISLVSGQPLKPRRFSELMPLLSQY